MPGKYDFYIRHFGAGLYYTPLRGTPSVNVTTAHPTPTNECVRCVVWLCICICISVIGMPIIIVITAPTGRAFCDAVVPQPDAHRIVFCMACSKKDNQG
jgi:hypothetical protein